MQVETQARARKRALPKWIRMVRAEPSTYEKEVLNQGVLATAADVHKLVVDRLSREICEVIMVICLDGRNHAIGLSEIARGGGHGAGVMVPDVFRVPVACGASAVVLVHNHPSGSELPSNEDIELTKKCVSAGEVLGLPVVDHVIIAGRERYFSFLAHGLIGR